LFFSKKKKKKKILKKMAEPGAPGTPLNAVVSKRSRVPRFPQLWQQVAEFAQQSVAERRHAKKFVDTLRDLETFHLGTDTLPALSRLLSHAGKRDEDRKIARLAYHLVMRIAAESARAAADGAAEDGGGSRGAVELQAAPPLSLGARRRLIPGAHAAAFSPPPPLDPITASIAPSSPRAARSPGRAWDAGSGGSGDAGSAGGGSSGRSGGSSSPRGARAVSGALGSLKKQALARAGMGNRSSSPSSPGRSPS
jgi:uncharacterized membrane protein YgcG